MSLPSGGSATATELRETSCSSASARSPAGSPVATRTRTNRSRISYRSPTWACSAHVPRGAQEMALRVDPASSRLAADTGRTPNVEELAQYLELDHEDVATGLEAGSAHYSVSLDAPAPGGGAEEPQTLGDGLGSGEEGYELVEAKLSLSAAITRLPHLERQALELRIDGDLKQSEIAERMGCSQMQVSRLLRRAQENLRALTDPTLEPEPPTRP